VTVQLSIGLATLTCTVAIAACGSSTKPSGTAASHQTSGLAFAQCMRSHGLPNYPDPSQTGGGLAVGSGAGLDPQSPRSNQPRGTAASFSPARMAVETVRRVTTQLTATRIGLRLSLTAVIAAGARGVLVAGPGAGCRLPDPRTQARGRG
jgi:hypothetical protein